MGRPINKRYFGALPTADTNDKPLNDTAFNIPVEAAYIDGGARLSEEGADIFIVRQRSARRFEVQNADSNETAVCRLVDVGTDRDDSTGFDLSANEMVIIGVTTDNEVKTIRSMTNRLATDFNSVRYTWTVEDDSTATVLRLTAI